MSKYRLDRDTRTSDEEWVNRVYKLLDKKNMAQSELAKMLGVSPATVSNWLNNKTQPSIERIKEMAQIFGVDPSYLYVIAECKQLKNQSLQNATGLTESAIVRLKQLHKRAKRNPAWQEKIDVISLLIENERKTGFLEHLYEYLTGKYLVAANKAGEDEQSLHLLTVGGEDFDISPYSTELFERSTLSILQTDIEELKSVVDDKK